MSLGRAMNLLRHLVLPAALFMGHAVSALDNPIRLNSVGFLPDQPKQATVAAAATTFSVIRPADGKVVFSGRLTGPSTNADTGESLFMADFSPLKQSGPFQIEVAGVGRSPVFVIEEAVYGTPYATAMRAFYLWRCGMAVAVTNNGIILAHGACHTNDAWLDLATGNHAHQVSTGGWHDAGDYNKYVVNAGVTVGTLLRAWEDFGDKLEKIPLGLPEAGQPRPEFLSEVKWELDWLLTMRAADGSVYHKLSTEKFGPFIRPETELQPRYFAPWSSESTANFVAVLAAAGRIYHPFDAASADRYAQAAAKSYAFLCAHPGRHPADQSAFSTGTYSVNDNGARLWAAAEMWAATGREDCLQDCETRLQARNARVPLTWDYGNPELLGEVTYLFSQRSGRDNTLVTSLRSQVMQAADTIVRGAQGHGYARSRTVGYGWGFNGQLARQAVLLHAAHALAPRPEYAQAALDSLGYLFGRNIHGRSYVTGLGFKPPLHPHDRSSASAGNTGPWPGFLVGGPHPTPADWQDEQADFTTNEIAINWNSALVYALAWFAQPVKKDLTTAL